MSWQFPLLNLKIRLLREDLDSHMKECDWVSILVPECPRCTLLRDRIEATKRDIKEIGGLVSEGAAKLRIKANLLCRELEKHQDKCKMAPDCSECRSISERLLEVRGCLAQAQRSGE